MLLSPFSQAMGYDSPEGKGIYVRPTSDVAPDGWGEPRIDRSVSPPAPIDPGTIGGPLERVLIRKKKGSYKKSATKYFQKSGNITWWGELRNAQKPEKGRHVLSYKGPKLRYFKEEGFNYGDDESHNEIYYLGNFASCAPGPVLGACMRKLPFFDPAKQTTKEEYFLFVAVTENDQDVFYKKRWNLSLKTPLNFSDAVREEEKALYDAEKHPNGWHLLGSFPKVNDAYSPEIPWFFNQSGTAACTTRRTKKTHNNGNKDITEDAFVRLTATISESTANVQNIGGSDPMVWEERYEKTQGGYSSEDHHGWGHSWVEDTLKVDITMKGEQWLFGDYEGDVLHWGRIKYDMLRTQHEYFIKGDDNTIYEAVINGITQNITNHGIRGGQMAHNWFEYGVDNPDYIAAPGDHEWTIWIDAEERVRLFFGPDGDDTQFVDLHYYSNGTSDEWAGNPWQANNPWLYFYEFYTRWLRGFFDIRRLAFFSHDHHKYGLWQSRFSSTVDQTDKKKEVYYDVDNGNEGETKKKVNKDSKGACDFGWTIVQMEEWPASFAQTITRRSYIGEWPDDNYDGNVVEPGNRSFYQFDVIGDHAKGWPTIPELLYGPKNECKGNGVITENEEVCYSVEVPDVQREGEFIKISDMKPAGNLAGLVGFGEKFYPVGAC